MDGKKVGNYCIKSYWNCLSRSPYDLNFRNLILYNNQWIVNHSSLQFILSQQDRILLLVEKMVQRSHMISNEKYNKSAIMYTVSVNLRKLTPKPHPHSNPTPTGNNVKHASWSNVYYQISSINQHEPGVDCIDWWSTGGAHLSCQQLIASQ